MPNCKKKNSSGFTLIELLVAVGILLLITGGAIAGFITFSDRRVTQEAANDLRQMFVTAQQKAAVKETPTSCITSGTPLRGYRVSISTGTPQVVSLEAICAADGVTPPFSSGFVASDSMTLPNSVSVSPTTAIQFYTLQQGTSGTADYTITGSSATYQFSVEPGGTIGNVH